MTTEERRAIEERVGTKMDPASEDWVKEYPGVAAYQVNRAEADRAALLAALRELESLAEYLRSTRELVIAERDTLAKTVARQRRAIYRLAALVHEVLARDVEAADEAQSVREFRSVSRIRARLAKLEEGGRRE